MTGGGVEWSLSHEAAYAQSSIPPSTGYTIYGWGWWGLVVLDGIRELLVGVVVGCVSIV